MSDDTISILEALAAGRLTPSEAAARLAALDHEQAESADEPEAETPQVDAEETASDEPRRAAQSDWAKFEQGARDFVGQVGDAAAPFAKAARDRVKEFADRTRQPGVRNPFRSEGPAEDSSVSRIKVRCVTGRLRIIGDESVATVSAVGPHTLRRIGELVQITSETDIGPSLEGFNLFNPPRSGEDLRSIGFGKELVIRVNPSIKLDVEVTAGGMRVNDVLHLGDVRITGGNASIHGVTSLDSVLVQAGNATIAGAIQSGRGTINVESGNCKLSLSQESNVTVKAETKAARVSWPGTVHGAIDEYVIGNGSAKLEISAVAGNVSIRTVEE